MASSTPKTIAVIGCGNIGSRLLQSAAAVKAPHVLVYGVEPFEAARKLSAERFAEIDSASGTPHELSMVDTVHALPASVDLLVVACSAHQRMDALKEAMAKTRPAAVLLEKILFTRQSDYAIAQDMLEGIPTWVNTTRNIWPGYVALKRGLSNAPLTLTVRGSDWGLGSNGIHFLSLIEMLSDASVVSLRIDNPIVRDSKRDGYRDLTATLTATLSDGSTAILESAEEKGNPIVVTLKQGDVTHVINNGENKRNGEPFKMLYTSQLGSALEQMLLDKTSGLPSLAESTRLHLLYLETFRPHIHPQAPNGDLCMVT